LALLEGLLVVGEGHNALVGACIGVSPVCWFMFQVSWLGVLLGILLECVQFWPVTGPLTGVGVSVWLFSSAAGMHAAMQFIQSINQSINVKSINQSMLNQSR
jgi:hypothetical protein